MISSLAVSAQIATDSELYKILKEKDSLIFDVGFNKCETSVYPDLLAEDLEFYHDQGGITETSETFIRNFENGICGNPNFSSRRELIKGSLAVFPLYRNGELYGAIQTGKHRFFESFDGKPEVPGSTAKFTHLWLLSDDRWILKRVLSYDHQM